MGVILTTIRAAALHSLNQPLQAPRRIWGAAVGIWQFMRLRERSPNANRRLIAGCQICPVFDPKWRACGDGKRKMHNGDFVGCLCAMDLKTSMPNATCWLHEQGVTDEGWPKE